MQRYSSVTLHVSPKNPISAEKLKITSNKSIFCPIKFFLSGVVQNKLKLYVFKMDFMTIQLKLTVPKKYGFRSWKGSNIWTLLYEHPHRFNFFWKASLSQSVSEPPFSSKSSKLNDSKTATAKDLKFWGNIYHSLCVMSHMSLVRCQVSRAMCLGWASLWGSVINGAALFICYPYNKTCFKQLCILELWYLSKIKHFLCRKKVLEIIWVEINDK